MAQDHHRALTDQILRDLARVNPYTSQERDHAYVYATGFLASYLASLSEEDPWVYKRFKRHIEENRHVKKINTNPSSNIK